MTFNYDLSVLKTKQHLLNYLDIDEVVFQCVCDFNYEEYIRRISEELSISSIPYFCRHDIPKKNRIRGTRTVWEAESSLGNIYKALARRLDFFFRKRIPDFPHECCFGYVRGRNIRENAQCHVGATRLLKVDIKQFFPSIKKSRIEEFFVELDVLPEVSKLLVDFLTIRDALPLGLATSPIISNAICLELDKKLEVLGKKYSSKYSRYADDITFSSDQELPTIEEVTEIIEACDFTVAKEKTRLSKRGQNHYVTGLSVSDPDAPHAPRRLKKGLRQDLYFADKYGLDEHLAHLGISGHECQRYINHLDGIVKYVAFQEPNLAKRIVPLWSKILSESGAGPSFEPKDQYSRGFDFFIDETEFFWDGKNYLALGMSASRHQDQLDEKTQEILEEFLASPWADGDKLAILKNGLHFNDATEDLKLRYIEALQKLPFNGYVVFGELTSFAVYEETYLRLLRSIITRRLMAAESRFAHFSFEETDKVSASAILEVINTAYKQLGDSNNRHPLSIEVQMVSKDVHGVSVPDFLLGAFRRYMMSGDTQLPPRREHVIFERLRDKLRVILNVDTGEIFSRRNPL